MPELACGGDLRRQQVAGAARVQVEVIGRRGAAAERQFGQADERAGVHRLLVDRRATAGTAICSQPNSGLSVIGG